MGNTDNVIGFAGNPDLYGLGIRIGYYTTALSIWVGNLWAPCEVIYVRQVTIIFLCAILIGVGVYSSNPSEIHSVEPYMIMQVAYFTYYMGLLIQPSPEFLVWEKEYYTFTINALIGLGLHGFDLWYWYVGKIKMMPTPGGKTYAFFIYFGQQDIYGYIAYIVKAYLIIFVTSMTFKCLSYMYFFRLEKKCDEQIPPIRLKTIFEAWEADFESDNKRLGFTGRLAPPQNTATIRHKYSISDISVRSAPLIISTSHLDNEDSPSLRKELDEKSISNQDKRNFATAPSNPVIKRTFSNQVRRFVLRWPDANNSPLPISNTNRQTYYSNEPEYEPSINNLTTGMQLLKDLGTPLVAANRRCRSVYLGYVQLYVFFRDMIIFPYLVVRYGPHIRLFIACFSHISSIGPRGEVSWITIWCRLLKHPTRMKLKPIDIALSSRLLLTVEPLEPLTRPQLYGWALLLASSCCLLVIGTELTIQWNAISGVQSLKTVGQLIPASIGVGGLFRVIYCGMYEREDHVKDPLDPESNKNVVKLVCNRRLPSSCMGQCKRVPEKRDWKEAADVWKRCVAWDEAIKAELKRKEQQERKSESFTAVTGKYGDNNGKKGLLMTEKMKIKMEDQDKDEIIDKMKQEMGV